MYLDARYGWYVVTALATSPARHALGVSRERMARMLEVSAKTIERWEGRDGPPTNPAHRARLGKLSEIAELGRVVYGDEGFKTFMSSPSSELRGRTPLQMLESGDQDRVLGMLAGDYEGLGH